MVKNSTYNYIKYLSLGIVPITGTGIYFFTNSINNIYIRSCIAIINSIVIFLNFPIFIKLLHTKPIYYEDILLIDLYSRHSNPYQLQTSFLYINGCTTIVFVALSSEYIYSSIVYNTSVITTLSTLGGIGILYSKLQLYIGKSILSVLFYIKNNQYAGTTEATEATDASATDHATACVNDIGGGIFNDVENQIYSHADVDMPWLWCWCNHRSFDNAHLWNTIHPSPRPGNEISFPT